MEMFGRKKIIVLKILAFVVMNMFMMILGFIGNEIPKIPIYVIFFLTLFFATFTFDMQLLGFENLQKN